MLPYLIAIGYVVCTILAYGLTLNEFTEQFPYMRHYFVARIIALFGPVGCLVVLMFGKQPLGLRFRHLSVEDRYAIYCNTYPTLGAETTIEQFDSEN